MNIRQKNIVSQVMSQALELNNYLDDDQIQEAVNMAQTSIDSDDYAGAVEAIEYLIACVEYRGKKPDLFQQELQDLKSYNSLAEAVMNKNLQASAYLESLAHAGEVIRIM